ncbi:MAG: hypothetical protein IOC54_16350 [Methylobacterium sp.]|nr:hypothetical protein [Methylobacterium sp.]
MATDAEVEAAWSVIQACGQPVGAGDGGTYIPRPPTKDDVRRALEAAEKARLPQPECWCRTTRAFLNLAASSFHSPAPYMPQEPVTITRIVAGFDPGTADEIGGAAWQEAHVTSADFVSDDTRDEDDERAEGCYVTVRLPLDTEIRAGIARVILPTPPEAP